MQKVPCLNVRFESKAQLEKFRKAAALRRWSLNSFVLASCETAAQLPVLDLRGEQLSGKKEATQ